MPLGPDSESLTQNSDQRSHSYPAYRESLERAKEIAAFKRRVEELEGKV